ncbi:MAG TPA: hypothetical protein VGG39_32615 [Polyangiaceae bacterium]
MHGLTVEDGHDRVDQDAEAGAQRGCEIGEELAGEVLDGVVVARGDGTERAAQPGVRARGHEELVPGLVEARAAALADEAKGEGRRGGNAARLVRCVLAIVQGLEATAVLVEHAAPDVVGDGDHQRVARREMAEETPL